MKKKNIYCIIIVIGLKTGGERMGKVIKKNIKIFILFLLFFILCYTFSSVYAEDFNANEWDPTPTTQPGDDKLLEIGNKIIGPVQMLGNLISVITIIIIGIKYMLGSVEEKAQYKETLGPYFLGAIFVFGTINIVSIIYDFAKAF